MTFDPRRRIGQMLRCELRVAIHHLTRLPAAQVFQLVAGRSRLPMPGGPGMPQVMKAQIREARFPDRPPPNLVADLPADRLALASEAVLRMPPLLFPQDLDRILVQRHASRRSILGLIQPGGLPVQINPVPLQAGNLARPATRRQRKPHQRRQVVGTVLQEPVHLLAGEPPIPLDLARQQAHLRKGVDPLPFVPRHSQQAAHGGEMAIDRRRFVALPRLALHDRPNRVAVDLIQRQLAQVVSHRHCGIFCPQDTEIQCDRYI